MRCLSTKEPSAPRSTLRKPPLPERRTSPARKKGFILEHNGKANPIEENRRIAYTTETLHETPPEQNSLLSPVHVPEDPHAILKGDHPATSILANSSIVVQRQLEMMNLLVGFEQANKYVIMDPHGNHIGYMAEQEHGLGNAMARQMFRTHRSFTTHVFDRDQKEVLRFHRPFSWISSKIRVFDALNPRPDLEFSRETAVTKGVETIPPVAYQEGAVEISPMRISEMRVIGEAQQEWAPFRRRYNLFLHRPARPGPIDLDTPREKVGEISLGGDKAIDTVGDVKAQNDKAPGIFSQFAYINEPILSWDFTLLSSDDKLLGSVNRNFSGFAREIFTDTGVYALRMDAASREKDPKDLLPRTTKDVSTDVPAMTLDQRAVMLAMAVTVDYDYFSRHSHNSGGWFPIPLWWGGGAAEAGGAAAETGAIEAGGAAAGGAVRGAGGAIGAGEGAITGAGTMAGYEAMHRGRADYEEAQRGSERGEGHRGDDASPVSSEPLSNASPDQAPSQPPGSDAEGWGEQWPWSGGQGGGPSSGGGGGGPSSGGGSGSGDGGSWLEEFFS